MLDIKKSVKNIAALGANPSMKKAAKCLIASMFIFFKKQGASLALLECSASMFFFLGFLLVLSKQCIIFQ